MRHIQTEHGSVSMFFINQGYRQVIASNKYFEMFLFKKISSLYTFIILGKGGQINT